MLSRARARLLGTTASLALATNACTLPAGNVRVNSSHFVYPNSNVTAGKPTKGYTTRLCGLLFVSWNGFTTRATDAAYQDAIGKTDGDLLINASESRTQLVIPPLFQLCKTRVEGTSAKMEVGKQELH
jgi:hypothetical protein